MFRYSKLKTSLTNLILEKVAEWLNDFLEVNEIRKSSYIVVRLDYGWFTAKSAFYNVWIYSSLCKEVNCTNLLGFFLKYTDKLFPNNLSLSFWLSNACKLRVISFLCINSYKVKVKLSFWSKYALNFIAFIFTKKTVVYEYTCKLLSNSSWKKSGCNRWINTTWKSK